MGIQSTNWIPREEMINRILKIDRLLQDKDYRGIEEASYEHDYSVQEFVDNHKPQCFNKEQLGRFTDSMLEEIIDKPFFRYSMFENYLVTHDQICIED